MFKPGDFVHWKNTTCYNDCIYKIVSINGNVVELTFMFAQIGITVKGDLDRLSPVLPDCSCCNGVSMREGARAAHEKFGQPIKIESLSVDLTSLNQLETSKDWRLYFIRRAETVHAEKSVEITNQRAALTAKEREVMWLLATKKITIKPNMTANELAVEVKKYEGQFDKEYCSLVRIEAINLTDKLNKARLSFEDALMSFDGENARPKALDYLQIFEGFKTELKEP